MKQLFSITFALLLLASMGCKEGKSGQLANLNALDLNSHGIPVSIKAPEGAEVLNTKLVLEKGVNVKKDMFNVIVEVFEEYADPSGNPKLIKEDKLKDVKRKEEFSKLILDEENGFIYETNDKDIGVDYHFFYVSMKSGKQVEFTEGLSLLENYKQEDIQMMYSAVKQ